jgi:hypothetical protein
MPPQEGPKPAWQELEELANIQDNLGKSDDSTTRLFWLGRAVEHMEEICFAGMEDADPRLSVVQQAVLPQLQKIFSQRAIGDFNRVMFEMAQMEGHLHTLEYAIRLEAADIIPDIINEPHYHLGKLPDCFSRDVSVWKTYGNNREARDRAIMQTITHFRERFSILRKRIMDAITTENLESLDVDCHI